MSKFLNHFEALVVKKEKWILLIILLIFSLTYSYISIAKHQRFETFGWDLAFQDQLIWKWSNFKIAYMSMKDNMNSLGDHFTLTWMLLVPLYWIKSDPQMLLIAQAFSGVFAAFPLYFLSKKVLKSALLSFSICFLYLLFVSLQHGIFNDVHSTLFTPIFITAAYYFIEAKRWKSYFLAVIGLSLTKEEFGLLVAAIGLVILIKRKGVWPGIISIVYGISIFAFLTVFFMPYISSTPKFVHSSFGRLGNSVTQAAQTVSRRPDLLIWTLYDDPRKLDTLFKYFSSYGFLPLLSPIDLIPILQQLEIRFVDDYHVVRWRADNHYSAPMAALLAISSIYGLANLLWALKRFGFKGDYTYLLAALVFAVALWQDAYFHGPVNTLSKSQFYERYQWMNDNQKIIELVPKDAKVTANNNLAPRLSQRDTLYFLPDIKDSEYIAVDMLDGPNKYSPTDRENIAALVEQLKKDPDYTQVAKFGEAYLFKKTGNKSDPKLYDKFYRPQPL